MKDVLIFPTGIILVKKKNLTNFKSVLIREIYIKFIMKFLLFSVFLLILGSIYTISISFI